MHPSRLLLGLCLSVLMTACGPRGLTPDRELYGTWVDPIHGTQMTLREDMTMDFFGREGTWRVVDNSRFLTVVVRSIAISAWCSMALRTTMGSSSIHLISEHIPINLNSMHGVHSP